MVKNTWSRVATRIQTLSRTLPILQSALVTPNVSLPRLAATLRRSLSENARRRRTDGEDVRNQARGGEQRAWHPGHGHLLRAFIDVRWSVTVKTNDTLVSPTVDADTFSGITWG